MPLHPWGEWKPDISDYEGQATKNIMNVLPRGDGYGPFPSVAPFTSSLPGPCRGGFYALKPDGSVSIFAATATRLYRLNNTDFTWVDVSKGGSAYVSVSGDSQWRFAQFGGLLFATQKNEPLQVFDIVAGSAFANAPGSPPQAAGIDVVGRFLVLSGLLSAPYRIKWSGLNNVNASDSWTVGIKSSDEQDFPDGGIVRGVAGGEFGVIFQDQAIRRMSYVGGTLIFQIERISQDKGLFAPYSIIRAGELIFFYAGQGFHKIAPGGVPEQIGRERVDRYLTGALDKGNLQFFVGAADPRSSKVYWSLKTQSGPTGFYNLILGYDYVLDRWFPAGVQGEYLLGISQSGLTLENLDSISSSIDAMTLTLDAYATAVQPEIAQFDSVNKLGFFRGTPLEATLETSEQGTDGTRIFVNGFRPITDAVTVLGSCSYRETTSALASSTSEIAMNARTGRCDMRRSTRLSRFKTRVPAGQAWTFSAGVEPDFVTEGML